jgi:hypothetical protein
MLQRGLVAPAALFEKAAAWQATVRERAVRGISESDYATAVRVLRTLVANLEEE